MNQVLRPDEMKRQEQSFQTSTMEQEEEMPHIKQQEKRKLIGPYAFFIILALFLILAFGSYRLYATSSSKTIDQINESHNKFIQNGDSSSGRGGDSKTGSQDSKTSGNSNKPIGKHKPAGKDTITSNTDKGGFQGKKNQDDSNDDEENDSKDRKKESHQPSTEDENDTESVEQDTDEEDNGVWTPANQAVPGSVGPIRSP